MTQVVDATRRFDEVQLTSGTVSVEQSGHGPPVILVHGEDGSLFLNPFIAALGANREVHLINLPGWGVTPGSSAIEGVDDLGLVLTDYAMSQFASPTPVVGLSLGAWVTAEAAVFGQHLFSKVVLVSPVGIKTTARDERSYVDLWATDPVELRRLLYGDPSRMPDLRDLDDDEFLRLAHATEAVARHVWEPYLYDPKLARRLVRLTSPTLIVTGTDDHFVLEPSFGERWAELVAGASEHVALEGVGHRAEEEAPDELAAVIHEFLESPPS
jgi:pimeloyl-ACP methyl ester carboxylesterase